jgi:hypothetical protein
MATFRVYLARPTTEPPIWDFAETVVAANADIALGRAYQTWVREARPAPPPLSQCRKLVRDLSQRATLLAAAPQASAQNAFVQNLEDQVSQFLATQLDGAFSAVAYPSGFNYGITFGSNAWYNPATLHDIDTLLGTSSSGQLELTGGAFSTLYAQVLQAVTFSFSQQDQATINKQDTAASAQIASILTEFENAGGSYSNPLPFGGKLQDVFNQLTKQFGSLASLPDSLNALRNAIAAYKAIAGDSYALHNRYYAATARIAAALANVTSPSASNGGQQTGANSFYVGFTPNKLPSANQLIGSLQTTSNAVKISATLDNFSSTSSNLSISGGVGFEVPIAEIITLGISASASYDLSRYTSSSSNVTIDITYPGVTLFASMPSVLSTDNSTGWYALDILQGVVENTGKDATGYKLQGSEFDIDQMFGPGMVFSRLKTFVISQQPTITLTFTAAEVSRVASDLQVGASIKLDLFGLFTIGHASGSYTVQKVDSTSKQGSVVVTFGPPQVSGTIPIQQQVAYVLGGVASYPPNNV